MKKILIILSVIMLNVAIGLAGSIKVTGVNLDKTTLELKVGETADLQATIQPAGATNKNVEWSSKSNHTIAKVSNQGNVEGLIAGSDTIVVTTQDGDKTAQCVVTVTVDSLTYFKTQCDVLEKKISDLQEKLKEAGNFPDWLLYVLIGLLVILIVIIILMNNSYNKKQKKQKDGYDGKLQDYNKWVQAEKNGLKNQLEAYKIKVNELEREIKSLHDDIHNRSTRSTIPNHVSVQPPVHYQPQTLYAKSIIDGKFYGVREQANDDTIFELKLNKAGDTRANVTIYVSAHTKVIANASYLEGCEKQILGISTVQIVQEGIAIKDESGNWKITTPLKVEIK